ncbi:TPA: DUF2797 domain-containing protein [Candidatus Micrarchaeota archaeon]|nr:DUF2797 domain-containing protein [Candidatus Micrarchaeota archaeon]HIH30334.1 DUF2797 domain-containing protein [Candidatus Micrarchaeota archaeon]
MPHLLRFYSGEGKPTLLSRQDGEVAPVELEPGKQEDVDFSEKKACIGYRAPEGYLPCVNKAINVSQCPACNYLDMSKAYTVGDFSGYPSLYEEAKKEEYCLYLAGFGEDIIKCGVTRKERFEMRMREQGADFGCIVATYTGPDEIYQSEHALQYKFNFNNAVRMAEKMRRLVFDKNTARENYSSAVELVRSSGVLPDFIPNIIDFSGHYPRMTSPNLTYSVIGEILGAKGEILLFRSQGGREFAVNMRTKTGHFFERK